MDGRARRDVDGAERLKRQMAIVLFQERQEALVVVRGHVEVAEQEAIAALCLLQAAANEESDVLAGQIAFHEARVDARPERFLVHDEVATLAGRNLHRVDDLWREGHSASARCD